MTKSADKPAGPANEPEPDSPALSVDITVRHADWQPFAAALEAQAVFVWQELPFALPAAEVSLVLADDAFVAALNGEYRNKTGPTNVLSFPAQDFAAAMTPQQAAAAIGALAAPRLLGDIVLAYETLMAEAQAQGKTPEAHARHLLTHGLLHLIGYDHQDAEEAAAMEDLESALLAAQGLPDPYDAVSKGGAA